MKSRTISLKKLRKLLILQQIQMNLQNQSQVIQRILFGYPQVEKLTLLRALEPTPQRRKVNCFQQNTSISWWPRFGTKLIRRSRQLFLITRRVRRPVSRLTWKTLRRLGMQKQTTKAMVKSEKANSLSVSFSHLQNWGCSSVLLTHISIYWIYSVDMVDLFFFSLLFVSTSQAVYYSCFYLSFSAKPFLVLHIKQYFSLNRQKYH